LGCRFVNGIVLDFGVSSMQFDTPQRGFSFQSNGPLDMRYDPASPVKASDLVNEATEAELEEIIRTYGEERWAKRIAQAIVQARPLLTTSQLADVIDRSVGHRYQGMKIHPATRTFQALRIAVNQELQAIEAVLPQAVNALAPKGRLAMISFHSLEDRLVKDFVRRESRDCLCPPAQPICTCGHSALITMLNRKPIRPTEEEIAQNPRARSARLRVVERLAGT
jgi:16S rRNA (cytosine1402-N4)-methyltransferase